MFKSLKARILIGYLPEYLGSATSHTIKRLFPQEMAFHVDIFITQPSY